MKVQCPVNQVYDNSLWECVCMIGYYMSNGVCLPNVSGQPVCGKNQVYRDRRCVCADGFYNIDGLCGVCPPFETYDINSLHCHCAQGYERINGDCRLIIVPPVTPPVVTPPSCGVNEELVGGICQCMKDSFLVKGVCTYCVSPNFYDASMAICRPTCKDNEQLDLNSLKCICIGGYNNINGECSTCPPYSVYNSYE